jgi:hypothetical protein
LSLLIDDSVVLFQRLGGGATDGRMDRSSVDLTSQRQTATAKANHTVEVIDFANGPSSAHNQEREYRTGSSLR